MYLHENIHTSLPYSFFFHMNSYENSSYRNTFPEIALPKINKVLSLCRSLCFSTTPHYIGLK